MSSKLLLDQSSEIISQQICIGKMHLQPQGSDRLHLPHMETGAMYIELAQQKGKCSCKYISGGIFKVKARRMCSARGAKLLPVSVLISKLLLLLCCRDLMLYDKSLLFQSQAETLRLWWDLELGQEQMRFDIGKEKEVKLVKKCLG
ncbi:hypothetical protein F2Q70_00008393 [Brassica cretica]|uniref:Uncharacterized protein n=1 Tax=Brassica cretica TaxID=69181 RepID=A0A8S9LWY1_BRACR|nr:hypothetical protein F2Q70_00008393 [Brassica cretica]